MTEIIIVVLLILIGYFIYKSFLSKNIRNRKMKKLLRYLVNIILFIVLWGIMFLAPMKYSIDMGATSIAAIGGIVAIIISYKLVKRINKSNLWSSLFDETDKAI
jgi:TRAP-type C4-dicarboxylate transport system permease large subunit